ncbi:hypothetical protein M5D96_005169, partial [Drosophila gunungcola]
MTLAFLKKNSCPRGKYAKSRIAASQPLRDRAVWLKYVSMCVYVRQESLLLADDSWPRRSSSSR